MPRKSKKREKVLERLRKPPARITIRVTQIINAIIPYKTERRKGATEEYVELEEKLQSEFKEFSGCFLRPIIVYRWKDVDIEGHPSFICVKGKRVYLVRTKKSLYSKIHERRSKLQVAFYRYLLQKEYGGQWKAFIIIVYEEEGKLVYEREEVKITLKEVEEMLGKWYRQMSSLRVFLR